MCDAGSRLVQFGELEQKLGEARRDFIAAATRDFLQPLHMFLDGDMKTVQVTTQLLHRQQLTCFHCLPGTCTKIIRKFFSGYAAFYEAYCDVVHI